MTTPHHEATRPTRTAWRVLAGALVLVLVSGALVGARVWFFGIEDGDFATEPLADGGAVRLRRLWGGDAAPEAELQRVDADGRVLWAASIENVTTPYVLIIGDRVLTRMTRRPFVHAWLRSYALDSGALAWEQPCDDSGDGFSYTTQLTVIDRERVLEIVPTREGSRLRLRELERGALRWDVAGPAHAPGARIALRTFGGAWFLDSDDGVTSARLDLEDGSLDPGAPSDALGVCRTSDDVVHLARSGELVVRDASGHDVTLGRLRTSGRIVCARDGADLFVAWTDDEPTGQSSPTVPALTQRDHIALGASSTGLLALVCDRAVVWAIESAWGYLDVGITPPSDVARWTPRTDGTSLVGEVVEAPRFVHDEVGYEGGRHAPVRIERATGLASAGAAR
ncbi:MAG: hypothetical protein J0L92_18340 [Deltaproteobacteria bacterium]|nr:hypothetical protein [Deltaproteobacteria bacterium]